MELICRTDVCRVIYIACIAWNSVNYSFDTPTKRSVGVAGELSIDHQRRHGGMQL